MADPVGCEPLSTAIAASALANDVAFEFCAWRWFAQFSPEAPEPPFRHLLPWRRPRTKCPRREKPLLPAAERFTELLPVRLRAFQRVGAEAELAFGCAGGARRGIACRAYRPARFERGPVLGDARREVVPVGALKSLVAVADAALASLGEI